MPTGKVIADKDAQLKKSTFDMGHDTNATACFGEVFPVSFQVLSQPSHTHTKVEVLGRMFPLISPTFGRIQMVTQTNFVGLDEVFPKWRNLLTNRKSLLLETKVPTDTAHSQHEWYQSSLTMMPQMSLRSLFFLAFHCCDTAFKVPYAYSIGSDAMPNNIPFAVSGTSESGRKLVWLNRVIRNVTSGTAPSNSNDTFLTSLLDSDYPHYLSLDECDYKFLSKTPLYCYCGAYCLNQKGKRLKKILDGLGYPVSLAHGSDVRVNILPLLAYYRAYFVNYMLPLQNYINWENTACYKLIESFSHEMSNGVGDFDFDVTSSIAYDDLLKKRVELFIQFLKNELCYCMYVDNTIESQCLNSSMSSNTIETNPFWNLRTYQDLQVTNNEYLINNLGTQDLKPTITLTNSHLSALDIDVLKKMFIYTNRNTLAGAEIEKELIARGLTDFVTKTSCCYLGSSRQSIDISEVTSTSDTLSTNVDGSVDGRALADPCGRGVGYDNGNYIDFDNNQPGFLFTMFSVIPVTKGKETLNLQLLQTDMNSWYNPMFDGCGYEALPQSALSYVNDITDISGIGTENENMTSVFGLVPRYTGLKYKKNVLLGGFSNPSEMLSYSAYSLDSYMLRNVAESELVTNSSGSITSCTLAYQIGDGPRISLEDSRVCSYLIPSSSILWCRTLLSNYFGNFDRIFNQKSLAWRTMDKEGSGRPKRPDTSATEVIGIREDGGYLDSFIIHCIVEYKLTTQMLPISLSYGCSSDETNTKVDL